MRRPFDPAPALSGLLAMTLGAALFGACARSLLRNEEAPLVAVALGTCALPWLADRVANQAHPNRGAAVALAALLAAVVTLYALAVLTVEPIVVIGAGCSPGCWPTVLALLSAVAVMLAGPGYVLQRVQLRRSRALRLGSAVLATGALVVAVASALGRPSPRQWASSLPQVATWVDASSRRPDPTGCYTELASYSIYGVHFALDCRARGARESTRLGPISRDGYTLRRPVRHDWLVFTDNESHAYVVDPRTLRPREVYAHELRGEVSAPLVWIAFAALTAVMALVLSVPRRVPSLLDVEHHGEGVASFAGGRVRVPALAAMPPGPAVLSSGAVTAAHYRDAAVVDAAVVARATRAEHEALCDARDFTRALMALAFAVMAWTPLVAAVMRGLVS